VATTPDGINNLGQIVGGYMDSGHQLNGFLYSNAVFTTIDVPGALATSVRGINDEGEIVGTYVYSSYQDLGFVAIQSVPEPSSLVAAGTALRILTSACVVRRRRGAA
jgi:probable HAF family extracellular repeat protein